MSSLDFQGGGFLFTNEGGFSIIVLATSSTRELFLENADYLGPGKGRKLTIEYIFLFSFFYKCIGRSADIVFYKTKRH